MIKKINSEYKIDNNSSFTITMGTSNKKNPEVIYSILSTYIIPNTNNIDESIFDSVSKNVKKILKTKIGEVDLCEKDVIVVSDIAANRMLKDKQTYFDMQIYFKPQKKTLLENDKKFKTISNELYQTYIKGIVNDIENTLINNGFTTSKKKKNTKKQTIY